MSADDWRNFARCREVDPELFHPVGNTGAAIAQAEEAKAVCRRCPVADWCLQHALTHRIDEGIWGGLTAGERRRIHRRKTARAYGRNT
jgi:WhiB family redox-sensing transcriptional regulator